MQPTAQAVDIRGHHVAPKGAEELGSIAGVVAAAFARAVERLFLSSFSPAPRASTAPWEAIRRDRSALALPPPPWGTLPVESKAKRRWALAAWQPAAAPLAHRGYAGTTKPAPARAGFAANSR